MQKHIDFLQEGIVLKYSLFEFDKTADGELDFVKWNKELDSEN